MTNEEADKKQEWLGMDGVIAWHLIDRHADNWNDIGAMMNAWLRANVNAEREACAKIAEENLEDEPYGHAAFRCVNIANTIRDRGNK